MPNPNSNYTEWNNETIDQEKSSSHYDAFERQLSPLDPMSDRVSTILVWQHLTVQIREDKRKEFFQRMKSYKHFAPEKKMFIE